MGKTQKVNDKFTLEQVIDAIKGSSGIKATIQRKLGCSRNTVDNYLNRYATAMQAYEEEIETVGDVAESVIISAIRNRDVDTAKWYAKAKLKYRGYSDQSELKVGGETVLRVIYDDAGTGDSST